MATAGGLIQVGETVVLQRYNYMRTHVLNPTKESGDNIFYILLPIVGDPNLDLFLILDDTLQYVGSTIIYSGYDRTK
jgi:hypothetical protein